MIFLNYSKIDEPNQQIFYARDIYESLGYKKWSNFKRLVEKANQLINSSIEIGKIENTYKNVIIGRNTTRKIIDYKLDKDAINLIRKLSYNKLNTPMMKRNETTIFSMLKKYYESKNIKFDYQFKLDSYIYDCIINNNILVEFDEQHHKEKRQIEVDLKKDDAAKNNGFKLLRFGVNQDIIDMILRIDRLL